MFYNLVISDTNNIDNPYGNQIVFTFYEIEEAVKCARQILEISDYRVEILPIKEKDE